MNVGNSIQSFCNKCSCTTWHTVLHEVPQRWDDGDGVWENSTDYTIQCGGCRSVKLRNEWTASGMHDVTSVTDYPPAIIRKPPEWMSHWWAVEEMAGPVRLICGEVYKALQNDMPHLAAMGVRSVLEQVMIDKIGGDRHKFETNLDELCRQGYVSLLMRDRLQSVINAGHATIHRGHTPTQEDLSILVTIMEHVIESLYVHEASVKSMAARIPPRPAKVRNSAAASAARGDAP